MRQMLRLTNLDDPRRRCFGAIIVLFAVCTLTVRVATRYCFSSGLSNSTVTVQKHASPRSAHQQITPRLTKTAPAWMPPIVRSAVFYAPSFYPRVAPAGPPLPGLVFEESLY